MELNAEVSDHIPIEEDRGIQNVDDRVPVDDPDRETRHPVHKPGGLSVSITRCRGGFSTK
jgi:hypothetical protein